MKSIIQRVLMTLAAMLVANQPGFTQGRETEQEKIVRSFVQAVYQSNTGDQEIASKYIHLMDGKSQYSTEKRYEIAANHIHLLRAGETIAAINGPSIDRNALAELSIVPYSTLGQESLVYFELTADQLKSVYGLVKNGRTVEYLFVQNGKIAAFDYFIKGAGGPAYFISY